jgi:hypothetical protein
MRSMTDRIADAAREYVVTRTALFDNADATYTEILAHRSDDAFTALFALVWAEDAPPSETQAFNPLGRTRESEMA